MKFNIQHYGALPNGMLCTDQIQHAIDDCFLSGGGEVVIPEGKYLTGGLRLRSGITLHLLENAVLMGSTCLDDYCGYIDDQIEPISALERESHVETVKRGAKIGKSAFPYSRWNNAIIRAIHAKNIAIIGERGSEINGQNCYDPLGEEGYRGPHAINMWFCENIHLQGYTVRDSANWAHAIQNSSDIHASAITVLGGHDGFDVRTCDDILIEDSTFKTGDDCIAGFDNVNCTIRNCYFEGACSILRFGGTDVLVDNCKCVAPATYGHRYTLSDEEKRAGASTTDACRRNTMNAFTYYCDNRAEIRKTPGNILMRNCHFKNVDAIMQLPFGHVWCCNRSLADITFENCTFDGICRPMKLECPAEEPLTVRMRRCTVVGRAGYEEIPFITGTNVATVELENTTFENLTSPVVLCEPKATVNIID